MPIYFALDGFMLGKVVTIMLMSSLINHNIIYIYIYIYVYMHIYINYYNCRYIYIIICTGFECMMCNILNSLHSILLYNI